MEILVYIQLESGNINENSVDLVSYAKYILMNAKKENTEGLTDGINCVSGVVVLPADFNEDCVSKFDFLKIYGLNKLYIIKSNTPDFDKRNYGKYISKLTQKIKPDIFILNSATEGREIAPVVASSLDTGLTADCTKLEIINNKLVSTRPTYGGKLMASILCKKNPQMATVRVNTFKKCELQSELSPLEMQVFEFEGDNLKSEILNYIKNKAEFCNLKNAKIILAGGMGLKNKKNFDKLKFLSELMCAKTGATRKAVDKGFIEKDAQIGQTGNCVTPELYIAFGIRGAIHHIAGMENSKKIIAINTDKDAPIFKTADIGIVEDANSVLEKLIEIYKNK